MRTPPHDPVAGEIRRVTARAEEDLCVEEVESIWFGDQRLTGGDVPVDEGWCEESHESAWMVDVKGQDGPFVSVVESTFVCCPETRTWRCVTYDVRTSVAATLEGYDERRAERRWSRAQKVAATRGVVANRDQFLIGDGHVTFCATSGSEMVPISVK